MEWLVKHEFRDPHWAARELDIRKEAYDIAQRLLEDKGTAVTFAALKRPTMGGLGGYEEITIRPSNVGGVEQVLLIEELLRRAFGISREEEIEAALARARASLGL